MKSINLKIDKQIAVLTFDQPDSRVNILNGEAMQELSLAIDEISARPQVKALIITSNKDGIFIAGADIKEIQNIGSAREAKDKAERGKDILNRLQNLGIISVAVINGACLGGGLELALACKHRVATFSPQVKIGLPEVNLGVIPGFGGTQRLPRLIGLIPALNMILGAQIISGTEALKYGLVDRLFPQARLMEEVFDFVNSLLAGMALPKKKRKLSRIFLEDTALGRVILFGQVKKNILKKTKRFYPAPLKALELIRRTYRKDLRRGLLLESIAFSELAVTDISKNLIKVFYLSEEFKKLAWISRQVEPAKIKKCAIVGAGVMGGGIAQLVSSNDIPVRLKDINYDALKKALKTAGGLFEYGLKKRKFRKHQVEYKLGLISPTVDYSGFENAGIIIEAVVEDAGIKQKVFKELSGIVPARAVLASNTSSIPIAKLSEAATFPERVVGLHFFNPVHRMPLIEVIKTSRTSEETLATVISFARSIGKVVIVVNDVVGFLINRILLFYLNEAGHLIEEGVDAGRIDSVARGFGMPMGPLEVVDEIGIDVGYKVARILEDAYGARMRIPAVLEETRRKGLFGKKTGQGFYIHRGRKKTPNPAIYKLIKPACRRQASDEVILKRLIYVMVNEAARCLGEGVTDRPQVVDIGMIMGTGFPPFRAGLLRYADSAGIENIARTLEDLEEETGDIRFRPCAYLLDKAGKKEDFYG